MNSIPELLLDETIVNQKGNIKFTGVELGVYTVENFLNKLLDLHLRATDQTPIIDLEVAPSGSDSRKIFRGMITTYLCSYQRLAKDTKIELLNNILDHVFSRQSNEGFESVFLTTLAACKYDIDDSKMELYFTKFSTFGWPALNGAGYSTSYFVDENEELVAIKPDFKKEFDKLKLSINSYSSAKEKIKAKQAQYYDMTETQCVGKFSAAGAIIVGTIEAGIGAAATGGPGAVAGAIDGAEHGSVAGGVIGSIFCDDIINDDDEEGKKDTDKNKPKGNDDSDEETDDSYLIEIIEDKEEGGCISPYANDFIIADPYAGKIKFQSIKSSMPYGKGAFLYIEKSGSFFKLASTPKFVYQYGKIDISSLEYLNQSTGLMSSIDEHNKLMSLDNIKGVIDDKKNKYSQKLSQKVEKKDTVTNFGADKITPAPLIPQGAETLSKELAKEKLKTGNKGL